MFSGHTQNYILSYLMLCSTYYFWYRRKTVISIVHTQMHETYCRDSVYWGIAENKQSTIKNTYFSVTCFSIWNIITIEKIPLSSKIRQCGSRKPPAVRVQGHLSGSTEIEDSLEHPREFNSWDVMKNFRSSGECFLCSEFFCAFVTVETVVCWDLCFIYI